MPGSRGRKALVGVQPLLRAVDDVVRTWIAAGPLIMALSLTLAWWRARHGHRRRAVLTAAVDIAVVVAALSALYLVMVPIPDVPPGMMNLTPGSEVVAGVFGREPLWQVVGNVLLLLPLGALLPLRIGWLRGIGRVAIAGFCCAVLIESMQYALNTGRICTADDVLLNCAGAALGALATRRWWTRRIRPVARLAGPYSPVWITPALPEPLLDGQRSAA
ncbi:VanZ family protein [Tamaricihabitans halophyticus]|uniref:VanZ family protein n=1 Tax=Tamaricihabitans halophyticus TaxID=1262583 RepID=UPI001404B982|nr:VanZ family protein [Tamaricihabitans halophyticus]